MDERTAEAMQHACNYLLGYLTAMAGCGPTEEVRESAMEAQEAVYGMLAAAIQPREQEEAQE